VSPFPKMDHEAMQQALLNDPRVQDAMKKAGQKALDDPAVQAKILEIAKEKGPEYAKMGADQVKQWAADPAVQAKAYHYAGMAGAYVGQAGELTVGLVEQGPTGVRLLAFIASVLSCVNAALYFTNMSHLFNIAALVISGYQCLFSVTAIIFEAPPTIIEKIPAITGYQDMLIQKAKFISEVLGRGLFYIFQGSLWLAFASLTKIFDLATGLFLVAVGLLHVAMHFGKLGTVAAKMREGYEKLSTKQSGP